MKIMWRPANFGWRKVLIVLAITVAVAGLLLFRLGSLAGGLSQHELQQQLFSSSWRHIARDPLNLPLTGLQWVFLTIIPHHGHTVTRLASPIIGLLTLLAFYYVVRRWYGQRASIFGLIIFATSSWFLHASRLATPEILYLWAVPMLLATLLYWDRHRERAIISYLAVAALAVLLYIPGLVWLVLVALGLQPHHLTDTWKQLKQWWQKLALAALFLAAVAPLGLALYKNHHLIQTWIGLPAHFTSATHVTHGLIHSVSFMFYRGPINPELWLDRLPVFDIFCMVMALLGIMFYIRHLLAGRSRLIIGLFAVSAVLFALGGPVGYSVLVGQWYLLVVGGIGYLLHEWFHVFPRNPLAKSIGYGLLSLAVVLACSYNVGAYFVAWPHNIQTIATFRTHK